MGPLVNAASPNGPFQQQTPKKEGLLGKLFGKSKQKSPQNLFAPPSGMKTRDSVVAEVF